MTATPITEVLIVGAGPVGLTLACDLARRGITCRIIDQEATYHTGRAAGLSPRTQEIFEDLGLLAQLAAYDAPIPWRFYDRDNHLVREIDPTSHPLPATPDVPYPGTLNVGQQEIETVLRECLASFGRHVELDCRLVDFIQHPDYVVASVRHEGMGEAILARYLVGCDGGHSTVRKGAGIPFEGETRPNAYSLAGVIRVSGLAPTCRHIWRDPESGFQLSLTPRIHEETWVVVMGTTLDDVPTASVETLQRLFDERVGMPGSSTSSAARTSPCSFSARSPCHRCLLSILATCARIASPSQAARFLMPPSSTVIDMPPAPTASLMTR